MYPLLALPSHTISGLKSVDQDCPPEDQEEEPSQVVAILLVIFPHVGLNVTHISGAGTVGVVGVGGGVIVGVVGGIEGVFGTTATPPVFVVP